MHKVILSAVLLGKALTDIVNRETDGTGRRDVVFTGELLSGDVEAVDVVGGFGGRRGEAFVEG